MLMSPRDILPWAFLCKNHPLDDLQENSLFVKHIESQKWAARLSFSQFSPVKVFGRPDSLASHCLF
jgi:hypothetical protein